MAFSMHSVNNTLKCAMCDNQMSNGIIRDSFYYCNTNCYTNKMFFDNLSQPQLQSQPQPQMQIQKKTTSTQPSTKSTGRSYGTCATCRNKYDCKHGCVDTGDKWFCSQTCSRISSSGNNMQYPAVAFPFAPNTLTIFPIHVDARGGKLIF